SSDLVAEDARDLLPVLGDEDFFARLEEELEPEPLVGDEAGPGAGGLEDAGGGAEAGAGHGVARDVEHGPGRAVQRVVVSGVDVPEVRDVRGHRLVVPAVAADEEPAVGEEFGGAEKERL